MKLGFFKGMVIASLNVNSLPVHKDEVETLLKDQGIHILALNETKIDDNYPSDLLQLDGYRFVRYDRNRDGGGVGFYISNTVVADVRDDLPSFSLEVRCIEVKPVKAKSFFVVTWYRPPSDHADTFDRLDQFFRVLDAEDKEMIMLGDTNCNVLELPKMVIIFHLAQSVSCNFMTLSIFNNLFLSLHVRLLLYLRL